jgi:hypothetical protein
MHVLHYGVHQFQSCFLSVRTDEVAKQKKQECGQRFGQSHIWDGVARNTNVDLERQDRLECQPSHREKENKILLHALRHKIFLYTPEEDALLFSSLQ